jgi:glutamate carboxypeptidase
MVAEAMESLFPSVFNDTTWIILINASEERLTSDFGDLCKKKFGKGTQAALIFEAGKLEENTFSIVTARKGMAIYEILVEGKSAHAGNNHQTGANAIVQLSKTIQQISSLTNYQNKLTYNIGVISGGSVPNRVPHYARARGEMRAFSEAIYKQGLSDLLALKHQKPLSSALGDYSCKVEINVSQKNPPWPRNSNTDKLFKIWKETAESFGKRVMREERGGLSDGNHTWDWIPTIDGLGPDGGNAHCSERDSKGKKDQEYVTISSFTPKAILNTLAILNLINTARV